MSSSHFDEPKVAIIFTTFKDPALLKGTLYSLNETKYRNCEIFVVDCFSRYVEDFVKEFAKECRFPVHYNRLSRNLGAAYQLNKGLILANCHDDAKYIARIEDDVSLVDPDWLLRLVQLIEQDSNVAIAMPIDTTRNGRLSYGGYLYGNCTFCSIGKPQAKIYPCMGTGGHCYVVRRSYIVETLKQGVKPYCDFFFISSEDMDFNLKAWLRGYKVVCTTSTQVLHEGTTGPKRAPYRVYHMYKNRLCLLLLNFGLKHIIVNVWYRILHDVASALLYSEPALMLKAYFWIIVHLREILQERALRMARWKHVSDKELKRRVLVKLPMPIKKY